MLRYLLNKIWNVNISDMWWVVVRHFRGVGYHLGMKPYDDELRDVQLFYANYPYHMSITIFIYNAWFYLIEGPFLLLGKFFDYLANEPVDLKNWNAHYPDQSFDRLGVYSKAFYILGWLPATILSGTFLAAWYVASYVLTAVATPLLPIFQAVASLLLLFPVGILVGLGQKIWNGIKSCSRVNHLNENNRQFADNLIDVPSSAEANPEVPRVNEPDSANWSACSITYHEFSDETGSLYTPMVLECGHTMSQEAVGRMNKCPYDRLAIKRSAPNFALMDAIKAKHQLTMFSQQPNEEKSPEPQLPHNEVQFGS